MSVKLFLVFLKRHVKGDPEDIRPEKSDPDEVLELLWPFLSPFQGKKRDRLRALRYDAASERVVDEAMEKWSQSAAPKPPKMPPLAQRVFLERLRQSIIVIQANAAAGELLLVPPRSLPLYLRRVAAALLWLHEMELPYPVDVEAVH